MTVNTLIISGCHGGGLFQLVTLLSAAAGHDLYNIHGLSQNIHNIRQVVARYTLQSMGVTYTYTYQMYHVCCLLVQMLNAVLFDLLLANL